MVAKSGDQLLAESAVQSVRRDLVPRASVITPNRMEAEVLLGRPVLTREDARDAARRLVDLGASAGRRQGRSL